MMRPFYYFTLDLVIQLQQNTKLFDIYFLRFYSLFFLQQKQPKKKEKKKKNRRTYAVYVDVCVCVWVQNVLSNTIGINDNMQIQVYFIFDSWEILNFFFFMFYYSIKSFSGIFQIMIISNT